MSARLEPSLDSARVIVGALRGAIEHGGSDGDNRRLLLLLDALEGELQPSAASAKRRRRGG
ncbi:MAG TPA: hypothetical protein VN947_06290 [Polyangia bacterium]|nr:hypothetical protein [Polyangia bacterium]